MQKLAEKIHYSLIPKYLSKQAKTLGVRTFGDVLKISEKAQGQFLSGDDSLYFTSINFGTFERQGKITHKHLRGILLDILKKNG